MVTVTVKGVRYLRFNTFAEFVEQLEGGSAAENAAFPLAIGEGGLRTGTGTRDRRDCYDYGCGGVDDDGVGEDGSGDGGGND